MLYIFCGTCRLLSMHPQDKSLIARVLVRIIFMLHTFYIFIFLSWVLVFETLIIFAAILVRDNFNVFCCCFYATCYIITLVVQDKMARWLVTKYFIICYNLLVFVLIIYFTNNIFFNCIIGNKCFQSYYKLSFIVLFLKLSKDKSKWLDEW